MTNLELRKIILPSLVVGFVAAFSMQLPLVGLVLALVATPLMLLVPVLGTTGAHVEIGFAWISLNSIFAWTAFVGYFSFLSGLALWGRQLLKAKQKEKEP